jgi:hypothetical protein
MMVGGPLAGPCEEAPQPAIKSVIIATAAQMNIRWGELNSSMSLFPFMKGAMLSVTGKAPSVNDGMVYLLHEIAPQGSSAAETDGTARPQ